jgi:hypothetical protein
VDAFLENAQRIFDVARSDDGAEPNDFALLIRPDGGLHFVMESASSYSDSEIESAAIHGEARTAYRVTKTRGGGVRVAGRSGNQQCVLEHHAPLGLGLGLTGSPDRTRRFSAELLRDQPLYRISSPLTIAAAS